MDTIEENRIKIKIPEKHDKPESAEVFYNPRMELNRDLSIASAKAYFGRKKIRICEPFCASGVRAIRYAKELGAEVVAGDWNARAVELTKKNASLNKVKMQVLKGNANSILYNGLYDLVDIDPFGTPAPFLEAAAHSTKNKGMLGITATDAPALCGVRPKVCLRNYGAVSLRTEYCHELAVRILLGAVARAAAKFEKSIKPLLSLSDQHYFRLQIKIERGAEKANKCLKELGFAYHCFKCGRRKIEKGLIAKQEKCKCGKKFERAGPLWAGKIFDKQFCKKVLKVVEGPAKLEKLVSLMAEEADAPPLYYNVHNLFRGRNAPKMDFILKKYKATRTHFTPIGIRTNSKKMR